MSNNDEVSSQINQTFYKIDKKMIFSNISYSKEKTRVVYNYVDK